MMKFIVKGFLEVKQYLIMHLSKQKDELECMKRYLWKIRSSNESQSCEKWHYSSQEKSNFSKNIGISFNSEIKEKKVRKGQIFNFSSRQNTIIKNPELHLESKLFDKKFELQKLAYKTKLMEIQKLIRRSLELTQQYGYFYLTPSMIQFDPLAFDKFHIWIHPNIHATKPLHPIKRSNDQQCELQFVNCLKKTLKELFPTIDLGKGKTVLTLLIYIMDQCSMLKKKVRNSLCQKIFTKTQEIPKVKRSEYNNQNKVSKKNLQKVIKPQKYDGINKKTELIEKNEQQRGEKQGKTFPKQTFSTRMQSFHSNKSIQQRIKTLTLLPFKGNKRKRKSFDENFTVLKVKKTITEGNQIDAMGMRNRKINFTDNIKKSRLIGEENEKEEKLLKKSNIKKGMTTSVQIESEINNLFNSQFIEQNLYNHEIEEKKLKDSELSKVAEEFQQLF